MDEPAEPIEVLLHVGRIDDELVDDGSKPRQRKIEGDSGIRADHALDGGMRDVALVPERHVLQRRHHIGAHHACKPGDVLRQDRIALVRHRGRALLPFGEELLGLQHLGALQVTDFGREPLDRSGDHAERRKVHGVSIARDDLGRDRLDGKPHGLGHMRLDARVDLRESADRAGDGAGRDFRPRADQTLLGAEELGIGIGKLEPERGGLGVNAVRAADGGRELVLECALLERGQELVDIGKENIGSAHQLNIPAGVEHIG